MVSLGDAIATPDRPLKGHSKKVRTMFDFEYAGHKIEFAALPVASQIAMARRGLVHFLGNEQAAKVSARANREQEAAAKAFKEAYGRDATADEALAFVASDETKQGWKLDFIAEAIKALAEGSVGMGARGPAVDPIEAEMERIAKRQVTDILKANGIKVPRKDEAVQFADGSRKTMDEMVEGRLVKNADAIRKEAEKAVKDRKRQQDAAKAAAAKAAEAGAKSADDLGL